MYKNKAKNAQEAHECIRPTDMGRDPSALAKLEPDQRKLYDLIWKRSIASQMEAARFERTTIEIADAGATVGLRATGQVVIFDGFLKVYFEGRDDVELDGDSDDDRRLPEDRQRRARRAPLRHPRAALHPAAAALHRGHPRQAHGRTRHRPPLHLRLHRLDDPGARLRPQGAEPPDPRGQGPPRHRLPRELLHPLSRLQFHRRSRGGSRPGHHRRRELEGPARPLLDRLLRRPRRDHRAAHHRRAREDQRGARAPPLPGHPRGPRAAPLQGLRQRPAQLAHRALRRRLHRLLELPRMPLHPPARRRRGGRRHRRPRRQAAGLLRGRPARHPPEGPLRPLRPARRGHRRHPQAQALLDPQGHGPRRPSTSKRRSNSSRCPASSASTPRTARRSRPISAASAPT